MRALTLAATLVLLTCAVTASPTQTEPTAREKVSDAEAAAAAAQTALVKRAFAISKEVDAAGINVNTDARTRTVVLTGRVPSAAQKSAASRIAEVKVSTGYTVRNELAVRAKASGS